jgi:hypothetical protein
MSFQLASFPNSRIKPRPVRTTGTTQIVSVPGGGVATQILPADANRVNVLIRNLDSSRDLYYGYSPNVDNNVGVNGGFELKPFDTANLDDPRPIYIYNANPTAVLISLDIGQG